MKLIVYELKFKKGTDISNLSDEATTHMFLLDIAHSLSIIAERLQLAYPTEKEGLGKLQREGGRGYSGQV